MSTRAEDILKKVRRIELGTRKLVSSVLSGQYHTRFKGQGMQFSDFREYYAGDDIRHIDWKVTARTQLAHIKKFEEERDLVVYLLVDLSRSTYFGGVGKTKHEVITELAALLGFAAIQNNDKVGLVIFSDKVEKHVPPRKGRNHGMRIISELLSFEATGADTNVGAALRFYREIVKHTAVVIVLSDFLAEKSFGDELKRVGKKHDVIGIRVRDKMERDLPNLGVLDMVDAESGTGFFANTSMFGARDKFLKAVKENDARVQSAFKQAGLSMLDVETDEDYFKKVVSHFESRK